MGDVLAEMLLARDGEQPPADLRDRVDGAIARAQRVLLEAQAEDGHWLGQLEDPSWNGTGFPRVFHLQYHPYAKYFPLWALGVFRAARGT